MLRWLLWSPRRLLGAVVAALALLTAVTTLNVPGGSSVAGEAATNSGPAQVVPAPVVSVRATHDRETGQPRTVARPTTPPVSRTAAGASTTARTAGASTALQVAAAFTEAWTDTRGGNQEQWLSDVLEHASPYLADGLRQTDPTRLPDVQVTGPAIERGRGPGFLIAEVPLSGGQAVTVSVGRDNSRWLVTSIEPTVR